MSKIKRLTVRAYYKRYLSLYGLMSAAIGGLPILSKLLPEGWGGYVFPPLGDQGPIFRGAALILCALVTLIVYFAYPRYARYDKRERVRTLLLTAIVSVLGVMAFFILSQRFVRHIAVPTRNVELVVSVGYERTDFAQKTFGPATDWELLRYRGINEEEIQRLWTSRSIILVRLGLFVSYMAFLIGALSCTSLGVLFDIPVPPVQTPNGS